ncbi:nicotinate-nucleotide adenylyltransferase [Alkalibacillus silvisoli]|uniref:Probable nicotinate-nucleotide adenylyltransferase n=1 Tax=Alkalibacillus silvisoli TaxID=392823 RepID=A0ABN0ZSC4_9BACI
MKKIGLFGGTFDPPHIGHLSICHTVLDNLKLDEIWLIPTYQPPHKKGANETFTHRLNMLKRLTNANQIKVSTIESERKGLSYTIDTVRLLKEQFPQDEFYFIIGGDMVDFLPKWYAINELKKIIQFVGVARAGSHFSDESVIKVEMEEVNISSTHIRNQIKAGEKPQGLPTRVFKYIKEHDLYAN